MRRSIAMLAALLAVGTFGGQLAAKTAVGLTLHVDGMEPHVGQRFEVRLIESRSGLEVDRRIVSAIQVASFDVTFGGVLSGTDYRLELVADANENARYDAPPLDHSWQITVPASGTPVEVTFVHRGDLVDVGWSTADVGPLATIDGTVGAFEYAHTMADRATGMEVHWSNDAARLFIALVSPGTGWVALGLDPENAMQGADYILVAVTGERVIAEDHFGTSRFGHSLDERQDVLAATGIERNGRTTVEFVIPLDSQDAWDKSLSPGGTYTALLAFHASSDDLAARHTKRSRVAITLDP